MNIATILTCYNRKDKTIKCLQHLFAATTRYNEDCSKDDPVRIAVFLTDDGCTDGTAHAVTDICQGKELHIVQGNGQCYWAGGMRMAWREALKEKDRWQFYLLLNDDTYMYEDAFIHLLHAHSHALQHFGKPGIYSGITCDTTDTGKITYGGHVWTKYLLGQSRMLTPTGKPQLCDKANSNIMLIDRSVVDAIGIFHDGYQHGCADYDYSMQTRKRGIPVLVTATTCGTCEYDHRSNEELKARLLSMTLSQRKAFFKNPLHSQADIQLLKKRNTPIRYLPGALGRWLNVYMPHFYYFLSDIRK